MLARHSSNLNVHSRDISNPSPQKLAYSEEKRTRVNSATVANTIVPRPSLIRPSNLGLNQNAMLKEQISVRKRNFDDKQEKNLTAGQNSATFKPNKPRLPIN